MTQLLSRLRTLSYASSLPTALTIVRLLLVPFIVLSFNAHFMVLAALLFIIAALTDIADGALARALHAESQLGAFLDPVADKVLLIACYMCLSSSYLPFNLIPLWFLFLVVCQEGAIMAGSFYLSFIKKSEGVRPTMLGKLSSFGQLLFIGWLFLCGLFRCVPLGLCTLLLFLIVCVRFCTLAQYAMRLFKRPAL